ncbi:hypothetical protein QA641_39235 [Bradyrhizobium sp. CB1650]|uniref:hypothetical protein n=1 Tax=Bradyrhizobium sp. CB1650 TaxID=3039153 RepID=UPI002435E955|nr:hypothetical protein [Bradyrhizobium sp. CB1650]WGD51420.1 hypothetical protein QA641_39235 [Bradyrhizobium sp. CB1650]
MSATASARLRPLLVGSDEAQFPCLRPMVPDKRRDPDLGDALSPPADFRIFVKAGKHLSLTKCYLPVIEIKANLFSNVHIAHDWQLANSLACWRAVLIALGTVGRTDLVRARAAGKVEETSDR